MPLTGDYKGLARLKRALVSIAKPDGTGRTELLTPVQGEVKGLISEEFAQGIGPDGNPWKETRRGKPALISRRLPNAFGSRIDRGIVRFVAKTTRDLLNAHQKGHEFPARSIKAQTNFSSFNSKGKLVAARRIFKKDGTVRRGGYQRFHAAHSVGKRVLEARAIYPEGTMPLRWEEAIKRGLTGGMERWAAKAEK